MCLEKIDVAVLCGGLGTRLAGTIGDDIPKCLAPIKGKPYLAWLIGKLLKLGAQRVILCTGHLHVQVGEWMMRSEASYPRECFTYRSDPTGTADAIRNCAHLLRSDPILIMNADTLNTSDICGFVKQGAGQYAASLAGHVYGTGLIEYAGVYLMSQLAVQELRDSKYNHLPDFMRHLQAAGSAVTLVHGEYLDIGSPADYAKAEEFLDRHGI